MVQDTGLRELETLNTLLQIHSMDWLLASYSINSSLCSVHQKKSLLDFARYYSYFHWNIGM